MSTEASIRIILQDESGPTATAIPTDMPGAPVVPSATAPPVYKPRVPTQEQAGEAEPSATKQTTDRSRADSSQADTTQAIGTTASDLVKSTGRVVTANSAVGQISSVLDLVKSLRKAIRDAPSPSAPDTGREAPPEQLPAIENIADYDDTVVDDASDSEPDNRDTPTRDDYREVVTSLHELNRNLNAVIEGRNDSPGVTERVTDRSNVLDRSERTDSSTTLDRHTDRSSDRSSDRSRESSSNQELDHRTDRSSDRINERSHETFSNRELDRRTDRSSERHADRSQEHSSSRESNRVTETAKEKFTREKLQREGADHQRDRFENRRREINRIIGGGETTSERTVASLTTAVGRAIENRHEIRETSKETTKLERIEARRIEREAAREARDRKLQEHEPQSAGGKAVKRGVERFNAARDTFSDSTREVVSRVSEKASGVRESISEKASSVRENVTAKLSSVRESITETLRGAIENVADSKAGQRAKSIANTVQVTGRESWGIAKSTPTGQRIGQFAESAKAATSEAAKRVGSRIAESSAGQAVGRVGQRIAGSRVGQAVAGTAGRVVAGTFGRGAVTAGASAAGTTGAAATVGATGAAAAAGTGAAAGAGAATGAAAGGTAIAGTAAVATGPIGMTVAGVVVALGTMLLAFRGITKKLGDVSADIEEYSPELTEVSTGREIREDEQREDRAERLGPMLAQLEAAKADLSEEANELLTKILELVVREVVPPIKTIAEVGTAGVAGMNLLVESVETAIQQLLERPTNEEELKQALELIQAQVKFRAATQGVLRDDDPADSLRHDPDIQAFFAAGDAENAKKPKGIRPNNMPDGW